MTSTPTRIKKSYSISRESEQFIRRIRKSRHIASDSEALDQLVLEAKRANQRSAIDAAYKAYYDQASKTDLAAETAWAEFAEGELRELSQ